MLMGRYSDIFGRKPFLIMSLIGSCFGSLLQGLSRNMIVFIIFRSLTGLFAGSLILVQTVIADLIVPEERGVWLTRLESLNSFAFIIGPAVGGFVGTFSYRMPLWVAVKLFHVKVCLGRGIGHCSSSRQVPSPGDESARSREEREKSDGGSVFPAIYPAV